MAKYGKSAKKEVGKAVKKTKKGTQKSGKGGKAKSRKQAIAIGTVEGPQERREKSPRRRARRKRRVSECQASMSPVRGRRLTPAAVGCGCAASRPATWNRWKRSWSTRYPTMPVGSTNRSGTAFAPGISRRSGSSCARSRDNR